MSAKSLWNWITNRAAAGTPANTSLFPFAPQPGTALVTQAKHCTAAQIIAGGGGALDIGLRRKTLTFTDAQIKNLPVAPVVVEPGQAGKVITVIQAIAIIDTTAAPYTNVNPGAGNAFLGFGAQGFASLNLTDGAFPTETSFTDFFTFGEKDVWYIGGPYSNVLGSANLVNGNVSGDNVPGREAATFGAIGGDLVLTCNNNGVTPFTGGDPANSLRIEVLYWIA